MKTTEANTSQQDKIQALEERNAVLEQQLDWFKRQLFGRKSEKQLAYRQKHSELLVTEFFNWVYEQQQRTDLTPKNQLTKALNYVNERQVEMKVFLANPNVAMDTNHLERALRVIPMGRKNYLFCWSELGAEQLGILQSLLVTCRLQEINPYHYLVDVLQRVSMQPASKVDELTPRMWKEKFGDDFLTSDLA